MDWLACITSVLAATTGWLAFETRRTVKVATKALALEERPYFAFIDFKAYPGDPTKRHFRPFLVWENKGRVLIHFKIESVDVVANESVPSSQALNSAEGVAFPGVLVEFECPTIGDIDINQYWKGNMHFKVTYWTTANKQIYVAEEWFDFYGGRDKEGHKYSLWTRTKAPNYS